MKTAKETTAAKLGDRHLSVEPTTVEFPDIQADMKYIQSIKIRNLSQFVKRIRCVPPTSAEFSIVAENQSAVAPGMSITIDIEFLTRKPFDYVDKMLITAEGFRFEVALIARAPCADISFSTFVNFGTVCTRRTHQKEITFQNTGSEPGSFEIKPTPRRILHFTPQSGRLSKRGTPGDTQKVKVELTSNEPCTLHELVEVKMEGVSSLVPSTKSIDIHGTCTEQALHILLDKERTDSLDFGCLYHGQTKVVTVQLLNDGPTSCHFNAQVAAEDEAAAKGTLASSPKDTVAKAKQPLTVTPFTGQVPALGSVPLQFTFAPPLFTEDKGFVCTREQRLAEYAANYLYVGKIESEELNLTLRVRLAGRAVLPVLKVSPDMLQFGQCHVNQRRDIVLRITNSSEIMPLDFNIPTVPHLSINPAKGKLAPKQNQNCVVSFMPKALGKFSQELVIKYCTNMYSYRIQCYGDAPLIGEKPIAVRGLERTGRDFDPEHNFVDPNNLAIPPARVKNLQSLTKIMKTDLTRNQNTSEALDSIMLDMPEPTPYSLSPSAMQEHVRNKQKYSNLIKQSRLARKRQERDKGKPTGPIDIFFEDDVDAGMVPGSGLKSPRYNVDEFKAEKLYLHRPLDDDSGVRGVTGLRYVHDENKLIKKKFKAAPTTQAEVTECKMILENWQLGLISVSKGVLDFGNVYIRSQMVKSFSIYNDLPQAILVALQYEAEELSRSSPVSQVIPSAQAAGFDVVVSSTIPQNFQRQVVYTINGIHAFKLLVKAEITHVQIKMSRNEINFRFPEDSLERSLTEQLVLSNPGNAPARFQWVGASPVFTVNPSNGIIRAGASCNTEVTFNPPPSSAVMDGVLTLKTEDGEDQGQQLLCAGQAASADAVCSFLLRKLDFGVLAAGLASERPVTVVNNSKTTPAIFHVEYAPDGISVSPMRGKILPDGRTELEITVIMDKPMQLETILSLNIRGGKPIRLPIVATAVVPNVEFVEDGINFGQLTLGAVSTKPMSLRNSSAVEGTLYANLQPFPEFSLALLEGGSKDDDGDEVDPSALSPITMLQYTAAIGGASAVELGSPTMAAPQRSVGAMMGGEILHSPGAEDEEEEGSMQVYKIVVPPSCTLGLQLTYQPEGLGQHYFEFPIVATGGGKSEGLRKMVQAEALRPRMLFSSTTIDFKTKVVATGIQSIASVQELSLHNADDFAIEWKIDTEPLKRHMGVFAVDPAHGILEPGLDFRVRVAFLPSEPIEYKSSLNVYLSPPRTGADHEPEDPQDTLPPDESRPYLMLRIRGQGSVPKLVFDRREIVLPVVPLGIRSRCLFYITNEGYESLDVKVRLPTDTIRIPLTINFPEGQQLGITKPRIPVEVYFQSQKPSSFCAKIEFLDNDTGSYTLPISGTTENCILTCHQYLYRNIEFYTLEGDPVMLNEKEDTEGAAVGAAPSIKTGSMSVQSVAGYGGQDMSQVDFVVRWMNANVLKNPLEHFPQDLVSSNGRHLYEMIEFLSGKQVPQKADKQGQLTGRDKGVKPTSKEMSRVKTNLQQYEQLLNFLKQHGAMLSPIRPEHYLSNEQYLRHQQGINPGVSRRQVEKSFYPKSMEAWLSSILQTIKIFLMNRITPKALKSLPGMTDEAEFTASSEELAMADTGEPKKVSAELLAAMDPKGLSESNVYSVAECILLRWLNFHFWKANRERYHPRTVSCFDADLADSIVLSVVIQSHVPNCPALQMMRYPCTSAENYEENAGHIIAALQEIGLSFPIQVADIANAQAKDMLLFVMFLFQNLPHYVPKTTIVFSTMLGVAITKSVELTNPSKKAITYAVQRQGSNDFSIAADTLRIEPRQSISFPVEFHSKFSRPVEGQLIFTSRREGNVHAAAMVFKLRSKCTGKKARKTIHVSAVLYEVGTVDVDPENPFGDDADFQVNIREYTVCDENRNPIKSKRCENFDPFHLGASRVSVKAGSSAKLSASFLPFEAPAVFTALIGFFDPRVGEFYYEIVGNSSPPMPLESYKLQVKAEEFGTKELILPHRNINLDRARAWMEHPSRAGPNATKQTLPDSITYSVRLSSPYYTAPKQVTITAANQLANTAKAGNEKAEAKTLAPALKGANDRRPSLDQNGKNNTYGGNTANVAKLSIEFRPKEPGVYPCTITLSSDVDIRVYQIEGTGTAPNTHCALSFNTQARKHVTQEIPIVNPTDREWQIKPIFSQTGHDFDGPREFIAKKRQVNGQATMSFYPLTFKPEWVCDVKAQLVLHNAGTNEAYEYELHGVAEEPLAEEHVQIKCEARQKTSHVFAVKNYASMPCTFEVESDLVHISGPSSITVDGRSEEGYELVFQPLQAGQVTGCIMFRDSQTGYFTWYTVELLTLPPKPQQTLTLTCIIRQAVAVDIQLVNPLDEMVVFEVGLNGDGLLGEAEFVLAPKETATYELVFSPLLPAKRKGSAVFFNDVVGEFWYDLELVAEQAPPEELEPMEAELGRTAQVTIQIDNPTGQEVALKHRSTNKINFRVLQQRVVLPPLEPASVTIEYSPSSLGVSEEGQIIFEHASVGQWVYKVQGVGMVPSEARKVTVEAQVNRPKSSTITFKNPFLETIQAMIVLESKSERGVFALLNKKAKVQVGPLATTQIPFSFCPPSMTQHAAELSISVVKPSLIWVYEIQGVAEAPTDSTIHTFTVQARESLQSFYILSLIGLDTPVEERYRDSLDCKVEVPQQHKSLVDKCFDVSIQKDPSADHKAMSKEQVSLRVNFAPLRPFVAMCNLIIERASGGRWRFDLKLEATEPEVDDTILIQSPLNKPASVAFRLSNHTNVYAPFDAFFDAESAYEFTVKPTSGILEPAGTNGTIFEVTYKPTEYGKPVQGKLIIQTEDVYWSYLVKGTHPKYSAPVADKPKVQTRLSKEVQQHISQSKAERGKKNFIRNNMATGYPAGQGSRM